MPDFTLDLDDYDALRRLIYAHSGLWLGDNKVSFLKVRLAERLQERNISSAREYFHFIKYDPFGSSQEIQRLIDAVVINETWFFRETGPLEAWRESVLPELARRGRPVRLWSAACSTGEEPFTLAMLLLEAFPHAAAQFEILATDISQRALETARTGVYDPYSLRHTEAYWVSKYFAALPGGKQQIADPVRRLVHLGRANLIEPGLAARIRDMDLILCRNALIYFDEASRRAVHANLYAALKPGGHLIMGLSETMTHMTCPLEMTRVGTALLYRKT